MLPFRLTHTYLDYHHVLVAIDTAITLYAICFVVGLYSDWLCDIGVHFLLEMCLRISHQLPVYLW